MPIEGVGDGPHDLGADHTTAADVGGADIAQSDSATSDQGEAAIDGHSDIGAPPVGADFYESFSGPNDFRWYNVDHDEVIANFVGPLFDRPSYNGDDSSGKYRIIVKDTQIFRSAPASLRLYNSTAGGTSEVYSRKLTPTSEFWLTWWERLSADYEIFEGHKWFLVKLEQAGGDAYLNWQSWNGNEGKQLCSRVYNSGTIACAQQTFAPTTCIDLPPKRWYQYKLHLKLNAPGAADGFFQVFIDLQDGQGWRALWDLQNVDTIRCNTIRDVIGIRFGGTRQRSSGTSSKGTKWIDDIILSMSGAL